jgi:hypothetical protein
MMGSKCKRSENLSLIPIPVRVLDLRRLNPLLFQTYIEPTCLSTGGPKPPYFLVGLW